MGAIILIFLFLAAALAVDVARMYRLEQTQQDIADAAALAAAARLPDRNEARKAAMRFILQHDSDYVSAMNPDDIILDVSADNSSGTAGVIIYGAWRSIFLPQWLGGDRTHLTARYAIAITRIGWDSGLPLLPFGGSGGGIYALFLGDTDRASTIGVPRHGQNMVVEGSAHFNDCVEVGPGARSEPTVVGGRWEVECFLTGSVTAGPGGKVVAGAPEIPMPYVDPAQFVSDVVLDRDDLAATAYYDVTASNPNSWPRLVLSRGADGLYGTADDIVHPSIGVDYDPSNAHWRVMYTGSGNVTGSDVPGVAFGSGLDLRVDGDLSIGIPNGAIPQRYWLGSVVVSGRFDLTTNNSELRAVRRDMAIPGADNPGLALHAGENLTENDVAFNNHGNALNIYGLAYMTGIAIWSGNMSSVAASDKGTSGEYDAVGNGFVKGAFYAASLDNDGNNLKFWFDTPLLQGPLADDPIRPSQPLTPRVTLIR